MYSLPTGPPGDISDVNIPPDTITACSFVVQWSRPSSDPVCGSVWYIVTVTEGGMSTINDTTTLTNYHVTGLTNNTLYHVTVTASNNAGSSNATTTSMSIRTNSNGKSTRPICACMCIFHYTYYACVKESIQQYYAYDFCLLHTLFHVLTNLLIM